MLGLQEQSFINADSEQFPRSLALRLRKRGSWPFLGSLEQHTIVSISLVFPLSLQEPSAILLDLAVTPGHSTKYGLNVFAPQLGNVQSWRINYHHLLKQCGGTGSDHAGWLTIGVKLWRTITVCCYFIGCSCEKGCDTRRFLPQSWKKV